MLKELNLILEEEKKGTIVNVPTSLRKEILGFQKAHELRHKTYISIEHIVLIGLLHGLDGLHNEAEQMIGEAIKTTKQ